MTTRRLTNESDYQIPSEVPAVLPYGDMPRDKILITDLHRQKTKLLFPALVKVMADKDLLTKEKIVISVFGGSGTGKSEIGSVLAYYFSVNGWSSYVMSGDNYPYRGPQYNIPERRRVYRQAGLHGLLTEGLYTSSVKEQLAELWANNNDYDDSLVPKYPFLAVYRRYAIKALDDWLGSALEMDYITLNKIISDFKAGIPKIMLKRMGFKEDDIWYDEVDFSETNVLIIEWVHGSSPLLQGFDLGVMLGGTPVDTIQHRIDRKREDFIDGPIVMTILDIEDEQVQSRIDRADLIVTRAGELVTHDQYRQALYALGYTPQRLRLR